MKIIRIKDCSECSWHYDLSRMFGNKEASVLCYHPKIRPAFKPIPNYPTIPDWCELDEAEEGKERPIRWNILWNRFVKRFKGASVSEEEVFLWLKKQPEFKSTGKEKES